MTCQLTGKRYHDTDCSATIVGITDRQDIKTCTACKYGQTLLATVEFAEAFGEKVSNKQVEEIKEYSTAEYMRNALRYIVPRYKETKNIGIKFLRIIMQNNGWNGELKEIRAVMHHSGLTIGTSKTNTWIVKDTALLEYVKNENDVEG